jgi:hypothetical protein
MVSLHKGIRFEESATFPELPVSIQRVDAQQSNSFYQEKLLYSQWAMKLQRRRKCKSA